MTTSNITAAANTTPTTGASGTSANSAINPNGSLTSEATFLQLLVAQIQNQDPLNPTDSIQFVGQLVQFSQLEQLLNINQNIGTLVTDQTPATGTTTGTTGTTANTNTNTNPTGSTS